MDQNKPAPIKRTAKRVRYNEPEAHTCTSARCTGDYTCEFADVKCSVCGGPMKNKKTDSFDTKNAKCVGSEG